MDQPFWKARAAWPDQTELHLQVKLEEMKVCAMPVVENGFIVEKNVVVTADQPLGIWHLGGVELAPFVLSVQQVGLMKSLQKYSALERDSLKNWLFTTLQT